MKFIHCYILVGPQLVEPQIVFGFVRRRINRKPVKKGNYDVSKLRETDLPMLSDEECRASGWGNHNNGKDWDYYWGDFPTFIDLDNQICAGHKDENGYYDANHGTSVGDEGKN